MIRDFGGTRHMVAVINWFDELRRRGAQAAP